MLLSELLDGMEYTGDFDPALEPGNMEADSRSVMPGDLFIAMRGANSDGHAYAGDAIARGAVAVLAEDPSRIHSDTAVPVIGIASLSADLAFLADRFYYSPSSTLTVIGITGTNGKTSSAFFAKSIFEAMGRKTGLIGTICYMIGDKTLPAANTTPDGLRLHRLFADMRDAGVEVVVMEVSSHALSLGRVRHVAFDTAVLTNITEDHLDFHGSMEQYVQAKLSFLDYLAASPKKHKRFYYNGDTQYLDQVRQAVDQSGIESHTFGMGERFEYAARNAVSNLHTTSFDLTTPSGSVHIDMDMRGYFSIYNALAAAVCADAAGGAAIAAGLRHVMVPGRFEIVKSDTPFLVVVDYAHTDDALKNLIESARRLEPSKVITVFGCGGDRDRKKRPLMGRVVAELSDVAVLTSDNPRSEDPEAIIADILPAMQGAAASVVSIINRAEAIAYAIRSAGPKDIVLIAGKGHEDYQIFADHTIYFSDREQAAEVLGVL